MELKLNIYNKKNIVKTYTTDTYDIMFGTFEDLINTFDLDHLDIGDDVELIKSVSQIILNNFNGILKPLIKDIFDGLTDEELKYTKISEIGIVLINIVKFTIDQILKGAKGKN